MLNVSSNLSDTILVQANVTLCEEDLRQLFKKINLSPGSIVDKGTIGKFRILIYKFEITTPCSKVSDADFKFLKLTHNMIAPETRIRRNVAWAIYSLKTNLDLPNCFVGPENCLHHSFVYPKPEAEDERIEFLKSNIIQYYHLDKDTAPIKIQKNCEPWLHRCILPV